MIWPSLANSVTVNIPFLIVSICFSINRCLYISSKKNVAYKIYFKNYHKKFLPTLNALVFYATLLWGHVAECRRLWKLWHGVKGVWTCHKQKLIQNQTHSESMVFLPMLSHGTPYDFWTPTVHTTVCSTVPTSTAEQSWHRLRTFVYDELQASPRIIFCSYRNVTV